MRWISVIYSASHLEAEAILKVCQHFTPKVYIQIDRFETPVEGSDTPVRYQGLLFEVQGSLRLFGGLQQLIEQLIVRLMEHLKQHLWESSSTQCTHSAPETKLLELDKTEPLNYCFKLATANTAWLAWCLAKVQPCIQANSQPNYQTISQFKYQSNLLTEAELNQSADEDVLKSLPVQVLDLSIPDRQLMMQCGFETIGDLLSQPRDELAKRFGLSLLHQFDLLSGKQAFAVSAQPELISYEDQLEMPFHATDQSRIEKVIFQLLCRLQTSLVQSKRKAERLDFLFIQAHGVIPMQVISAHGLQHAKDWALLIQYQLSRLRFQDDVRWIKIRCEKFISAFDHNGTWLPDLNTDKKQWVELCDKLIARLGGDVVKLAYTIPDPRPEQSFEYRTPSKNEKSPNFKNQTGIVSTNIRLPESAVRPLWLLPAPLRLKGKAPDWSNTGDWHLLSGPERIDFGWWDKNARKRDYYRALNKDLTQAWLFCEEEFHQGKSTLNWYIHGYFG